MKVKNSTLQQKSRVLYRKFHLFNFTYQFDLRAKQKQKMQTNRENHKPFQCKENIFTIHCKTQEK